MFESFGCTIIAPPVAFLVLSLIGLAVSGRNWIGLLGIPILGALIALSITLPIEIFATGHSDYYSVNLTEQQLCDLSYLPNDTVIRDIKLLETKEVGGYEITRVVFSYKNTDHDKVRNLSKKQDYTLYRELDDLLLDIRDINYCGRILTPNDVKVLEVVLGSDFLVDTKDD